MLVELQEIEVLDLVEDGVIEIQVIGQTLEVEEVMILNQVKDGQEVHVTLEANDREVITLKDLTVQDDLEVMILNQVKDGQEVHVTLEANDREVITLKDLTVQDDLEVMILNLQVFQDLLETRIQNQVELVVLCQIQDLANILSKEIVINHLLLLFLW